MYKDAKGKILLTDKPMAHLKLASVAPSTMKYLANHKLLGQKAPKSSKPSASSDKKLQHFTRYNRTIKRAASKYKLDRRLVSAVVEVESQFNPMALSKSGAMGLMQLMPSTANQLGVENPFNPEQNIEGGTKYLRYLIERFKGNITHAIAAYNSGPLNVEKYGSVPPFKQTQRYVKKIYSIYKGSKIMDLSATGGKIIRRITMQDGTVVYTNHLQNGSQNF